MGPNAYENIQLYAEFRWAQMRMRTFNYMQSLVPGLKKKNLST
jgi:hypothetical protein